jgi:hypothetical protein
MIIKTETTELSTLFLFIINVMYTHYSPSLKYKTHRSAFVPPGPKLMD